MIRAFTLRDVIRNVPLRWRQQYPQDFYPAPDRKSLIGDQLDALDLETVTPAAITAIIGNSSWTVMTCDACEGETDALVTVGQTPDYESRTANLCQECAQKALDAISSARRA